MEFTVKGKINTNAKTHLKKLNFKGAKEELKANFATRKKKEKKRHDKIRKT
jgi:hypothetical protein